MWLRNEAGPWSGGPIADSVRAHGLRHPDDMSGVILEAYGFYLKNQPINLDSLIRAVPPPPRLESFEVLRSPTDSPARRRAAP